MKISTVILALGGFCSVMGNSIIAGNMGFNIGHHAPSGQCKSKEHWTADFRAIKSWSNPNVQIRTVRLFSTNDCSNLRNAVPAALATGMKIWATLWATPDSKFHMEKLSLESAIKKYGSGWLAGVNVGSEELYRGGLNGPQLAEKIHQTKQQIHKDLHLPNIPVGAADTWTSWVKPENKVVIDASDVILSNGFPYWQGASIDQGALLFSQAMQATRDAIGAKPLIIGETGWPTGGPPFGAALASVENQQIYWRTSVCPFLAQGVPYFWFSAFDEPQRTGDNGDVEKNFGIATADRHLKISLEC